MIGDESQFMEVAFNVTWRTSIVLQHLTQVYRSPARYLIQTQRRNRNLNNCATPSSCRIYLPVVIVGQLQSLIMGIGANYCLRK